MQSLVGIIGITVILIIAVLCSEQRKLIDYRLVVWGLLLQFLFAWFILNTRIGKPFFGAVDEAVRKLLGFANQGSTFLFQSFVSQKVEEPLLNIAFQVLPTIIFFAALMGALYHLGIMQFVVASLAKLMQRTLHTSGAETLSVVADIFVGQTEAPLLVRPFLATMTRSELMAVMTGGFATIAGGVMAVYVAMLAHVPGIAGHLMAASIMSAPAALLLAKILVPESGIAKTAGYVPISVERIDVNLLQAVTRGAGDGLKLALNVAAMLVAFVALVAMLDAILAVIGLSMAQILGWLFRPLAWLIGIPWHEAGQVGTLLGEKMVLTEMIAYGHLSEIVNRAPETLSPRSQVIASYALCGFANFASIGVQIGGTGSLVPERQSELAQLGMKAMLAATMANCMTAAIAGLFV